MLHASICLKWGNSPVSMLSGLKQCKSSIPALIILLCQSCSQAKTIPVVFPWYPADWMFVCIAYRITDNLPFVFCYKVQPIKDGPIVDHCDRSFPIGCYVNSKGEQKDLCNSRVSYSNYVKAWIRIAELVPRQDCLATEYQVLRDGYDFVVSNYKQVPLPICNSVCDSF